MLKIVVDFRLAISYNRPIDWENNTENMNMKTFIIDGVEYFFGLDAPKQKYKTGRSWEVEVWQFTN